MSSQAPRIGYQPWILVSGLCSGLWGKTGEMAAQTPGWGLPQQPCSTSLFWWCPFPPQNRVLRKAHPRSPIIPSSSPFQGLGGLLDPAGCWAPWAAGL